jgi:hypothetical protein
MGTKYACIYECSEWKIVEKLHEVTPHFSGSILSEALVVESIHLRAEIGVIGIRFEFERLPGKSNNTCVICRAS